MKMAIVHAANACIEHSLVMSAPATGKRKGPLTGSTTAPPAKPLHAARQPRLDANQKAVQKLVQREALSKCALEDPLCP